MFEGAKLKANWARHMIGQIEQAVQRFALEQRSEIFSNHNTETGELLVQVRGTPTFVRSDVIMLAGTVVQTLRSCLDYITSEIWNSRKGNTDTRIHFPINEDNAKLVTSGTYKKIESFDSGLAEFIANEIKPTKAENFPIWAINRLANTDKHRNLLLVAHWSGFEIDEIKRSDGVAMWKAKFTAPTGANNEDYISVPNVEEYSEPHAVLEIMISETDLFNPEKFHRLEIVSALRNLNQVVIQTIDKIEGFLAE